MTKVPGCCEQEPIKTSIAALWLNIANAYSSIPHQLILYSILLRANGINPTWIELTFYYNVLWNTSIFTKATSGWYKHYRGIFTGYAVSIILFLSGMNAVLEFIMAGINSSLSTKFSSPFYNSLHGWSFPISITQ